QEVRAEERNHGAIYAAGFLLEKLVTRYNWLNDLKRVFLNEEIGLIDFGKRLEEICRKFNVTVGAKGECIDGHGCGEKEEEQTLVKSSSIDKV
ncbi:hypothetical protein AM593_09540, partial [Mytilus galloprovincialis]